MIVFPGIYRAMNGNLKTLEIYHYLCQNWKQLFSDILSINFNNIIYKLNYEYMLYHGNVLPNDNIDSLINDCKIYFTYMYDHTSRDIKKLFNIGTINTLDDVRKSFDGAENSSGYSQTYIGSDNNFHLRYSSNNSGDMYSSGHTIRATVQVPISPDPFYITTAPTSHHITSSPDSYHIKSFPGFYRNGIGIAGIATGFSTLLSPHEHYNIKSHDKYFSTIIQSDTSTNIVSNNFIISLIILICNKNNNLNKFLKILPKDIDEDIYRSIYNISDNYTIIIDKLVRNCNQKYESLLIELYQESNYNFISYDITCFIKNKMDNIMNLILQDSRFRVFASHLTAASEIRNFKLLKLLINHPTCDIDNLPWNSSEDVD